MSAEAYEPLETGEGVIRESWEESTAQFSESPGDNPRMARFYFGNVHAGNAHGGRVGSDD